MNDSAERPADDQSADEELSASLAGHSDLPDHGGETSSAPVDATAEKALDGDSPVLEEIEDSPVRTKNS